MIFQHCRFQISGVFRDGGASVKVGRLANERGRREFVWGDLGTSSPRKF